MAAFLGKLFKRAEPLLAIDLGASSIKIAELDTSSSGVALTSVAIAPVSGEFFSSNSIVQPEGLAEVLSRVLEENSIEDRRVAIAMPSPSVFTKRIKIAKVPLDELTEHIQLESGNFIPHSMDAIRLDYHVLGEVGRNQLEVLIVAVKREIVDSYVECVAMAGLDTAVVDVDYFALQNAFELARGDLGGKTVALVNIGSRFSSINICRNGQSLFTGDMSIGGKFLTDAVAQELSIGLVEAEQLKRYDEKSASQNPALVEIVERNVEFMASEFNRQLSFFWSASGADDAIDRILISGGTSQTAGLCDAVSEKTGVHCELFDPLGGVAVGDEFDPAFVRGISPLLGVCVGLAIRQPGDRISPEGLS